MKSDIKERLFEEYRLLAQRAEEAFERVKAIHGDLVRCKLKCCDCCFAFFELTPIEAMYLHEQFIRELDPKKQEEILERARGAEVEYRRILERLGRLASLGNSRPKKYLDHVGRQRLACPLLNDEDLCDLYEHRPITCRVYGVPTRIAGEARTCGLSGFLKGGSYPTVNLDAIMEQLMAWSEELMRAQGTGGWRRGKPLISVSSALMGRFLPEEKDS